MKTPRGPYSGVINDIWGVSGLDMRDRMPSACLTNIPSMPAQRVPTLIAGHYAENSTREGPSREKPRVGLRTSMCLLIPTPTPSTQSSLRVCWSYLETTVIVACLVVLLPPKSLSWWCPQDHDVGDYDRSTSFLYNWESQVQRQSKSLGGGLNTCVCIDLRWIDITHSKK